MQKLNWTDLWLILCLERGGSITRAARLMGVDDTTVTRRLTRLEAETGTRLAIRRRGRLDLTETGRTLAAHAGTMEAAADAAAAALGVDDAGVSGEVRVTAVPILAHRVLGPGLAALGAAHPNLAVEIVAESRDLNLGRRETDIALRMARPTREAGMLTRRIAVLEHAVYAAEGTADLPWIGYDQDHAALEPNRWIRRTGMPIAPFRMNDAEGMIAAALAGLGKVLLPRVAGDRVPGLRRVADPCDLTRELWLIVPPELRHRPAVRAVIYWLEGCVTGGGSKRAVPRSGASRP